MDSPVVRQRMRTTYTGVMELEDVAGRNGSGLESSEHQEQWSCSNSHARADKRSKGDKVGATQMQRRCDSSRKWIAEARMMDECEG